MPTYSVQHCSCPLRFQADAVAQETGLSVAVFMMGTVEAAQRKLGKNSGVLLTDLEGASDRRQQAAVLSHATGGVAHDVVVKGDGVMSEMIMNTLLKSCQVGFVSCTSWVRMCACRCAAVQAPNVVICIYVCDHSCSHRWLWWQHDSGMYSGVETCTVLKTCHMPNCLLHSLPTCQ